MAKNIKLISTNSYFNIFNLLCKELEGKISIDEKNLIFMEEKGSLMAESIICSTFGGAFNTEVYSFGNFLRLKRGEDKVLSKEGSAMVIKKLIEDLPLAVLNRGRDSAPTIYELIALLKSAGVTLEEIIIASQKATGILKTKLCDIVEIFSAYENYLREKGLEDQNSFISLLPELLNNLEEIEKANIFVIGFSGLTKQNLTAIECLIKRAKSFTAILPYGDNKVAFVNETVEKIKTLCNDIGVKVERVEEKTPYLLEGEIISSSLFNPLKKHEEVKTDKIHLLTANSKDEEAEKIASIIKDEVLKGKRYKDFNVVLPTITDNAHIKKAFELLEVPYYLDTNYNVENHPAITLIFSYIDCFIKYGDREKILSLIKNPFYSSDKTTNDAFTNYVYKNKINYTEFFTPFTIPMEKREDFIRVENLRKRIEEDLNTFDVRAFLEKCEVEKKALDYAKKLRELDAAPESALTEQIYSKVVHILDEMEGILGRISDKREFKKLFTSGISALKVSILPQYNDAVFIGGFKECARGNSKNLFVCGLTSAVPGITEDTAILSDVEIDALSNIKVIVEPKVKIINHRSREEIVLALSSFSEKLYLSYSVNQDNGGVNEKSEIISFFEKTFTLLDFPKVDRYLSNRQALKSFATDIADFREWKRTDIKDAIAYLNANDDGKAKSVLDSANTEITRRLENKSVLLDNTIEPTSIEEFYTCPYRFFIGKALGVKERETGEIASNDMGILMHDVFCNFVKDIKEVDTKDKVKDLYLKCKEIVLSKDKYKKFLSSPSSLNSVMSALDECEKHCNDLYDFVASGEFVTEENNLEKSFELKFRGDEVTLKGKVDRIDTTNEYFRVIDYKTGSADSSDSGLYSGTKLQLWLYSLAIKDKQLAGAYYYDVKDEYKAIDAKDEGTLLKGKTLLNEEVIKMQDKNFFTEGKSKYLPITIKSGAISGAMSKETLLAYQEYAKAMCENAIDEMKKGTIIASPYKNACSWCKYKSICLTNGEKDRSEATIKESEIVNAIKGGEEDAKA